MTEPDKAITIVWEGFIGIPTDQYSPQAFKVRQAFRCYRAALNLFHVNALAIDAVWQIWGGGIKVDIVTYLPPAFAVPLGMRCQSDGIPYRSVSAGTVKETALSVTLEEHTLRIVDGDPTRHLTYGPKGLILAPQHAMNLPGIVL